MSQDDINIEDKSKIKIGQEFITSNLKFYELKIFQQISLILSLVIKLTIIGVIALVAILFLSISLALKLGELTQSLVLGYALVGLIYLILAAIIYVFRKSIDNTIVSKLSSKHKHKK